MKIGSAALAAAVVCLAAATGGCRSFSAYCTELVDCQDQPEDDIEWCENWWEEEAERASSAGCTSQFNGFFDCLEVEAECVEGVYTPGNKCDTEYTEFLYCMGDTYDR